MFLAVNILPTTLGSWCCRKPLDNCHFDAELDGLNMLAFFLVVALYSTAASETTCRNAQISPVPFKATITKEFNLICLSENQLGFINFCSGLLFEFYPLPV